MTSTKNESKDPEGQRSSPRRNDKADDVRRDWRLETLDRVRTLISKADPAMIEEVKWRKPTRPEGVSVWSHAGIICTGETYRDKVKITFAKGALIDDPAGLFNSSLEGSTRRAIDLREGDKIDGRGLQALIRAAAAVNTAAADSAVSRRARSPAAATGRPRTSVPVPKKPRRA